MLQNIKLSLNGIGISLIQNYKDVAKDPQLRANGYIKDREVFSDGKSFGIRPVIGYPIFYSETPVTDYPAAAPQLGEHTDSVLRDIVGLQEPQIAELAQAKVIRRGEKAGKL